MISECLDVHNTGSNGIQVDVVDNPQKRIPLLNEQSSVTPLKNMSSVRYQPVSVGVSVPIEPN
jgi:hypothetical protein